MKFDLEDYLEAYGEACYEVGYLHGREDPIVTEYEEREEAHDRFVQAIEKDRQERRDTLNDWISKASEYCKAQQRAESALDTAQSDNVGLALRIIGLKETVARLEGERDQLKAKNEWLKDDLRSACRDWRYVIDRYVPDPHARATLHCEVNQVEPE